MSVLRADAQRNLGHILEAARAVFAEEGLDASVAAVAERAGVGTATIFRRFPTKDHLLAAVIEERVRGLTESSRRAAESDEPRLALRHFLQEAVGGYISDRGFCEAAGKGLFAEARVRALIDELNVNVAVVLERAKQVGEVREDVTREDVSVLLMALAQAGSLLEHAAPGNWRRYLDIVLDGLRPEGAHPLSRKPLTRKQFDAARDGYRAGPV
jgi:AcrR family transcriptional regulator